MIKEKWQSSKVSMVPLGVVPITKILTTTAERSATPYTQYIEVVDQLTKVIENLLI